MRAASATILASLFLAVSVVTPAAPWGDAPTHPSMALSLLAMQDPEFVFPGGVDRARFVRATACADLANTQLFKSNGFEYVHTPEFAAILLEKMGTNPAYQATALAWTAHLAADQVAHESYIPPLQEPLHSLVEVAVDTVIYYNPTMQSVLTGSGFQRWEDTVLRGNDCSPTLVADASSKYVTKYGTGKPISWFQVWWATQSLATSIQAEYSYIRLKGDADASWLFLESVHKEDFIPWYKESVMAAACQINPSGLPCP